MGSLKKAAKKGNVQPAKPSKPGSGLALKLAQASNTGKKAPGSPGAAVWGKVKKEVKDFEQAHEESGAAPAKVRKQDEHINLKGMKLEIEKNLGARRQADEKEIQMADKPAIAKNLTSSEVKTKQGKQQFIKSGIQGLDELLGGGLPKDSIILLSGTCGTGKSIFGMNFLIEGAMKGEPGIYISLEESPESNIQQMKLFGWPVDDLIKQKKLMILQPELYNFDALLTTIEDSIDRIKAKRLVIDAISIIGMYFEDPYKVRKSILQLGALLKKMKCTTVAIDEIREGETSLSAYGVEEFVVDGVIVLYLIKRSNIYLRATVIRKMRGINHSTKIHPMEIKSPGGIIIYPSQELFEEVG
jgi:KaiC/GvpD/RAD55 family RecA-like ATPase